MSQPQSPDPSNGPEAQAAEPIWTFRGYQMRPADFNTALVHFYRGEVQRSNTWRLRLDNTTNWAVIAAGAAISFALSDPMHHYGVIILDTLLVTLFLWIEARRYRYYELWSYRVRLMETDFFAPGSSRPSRRTPNGRRAWRRRCLPRNFPSACGRPLAAASGATTCGFF